LNKVVDVKSDIKVLTPDEAEQLWDEKNWKVLKGGVNKLKESD